MALLTDAFKISFPIFVVLIVQATRIDSTTCPALKPVSNFNATAFAGRWYEIKRFKTVVNGLGGTCASFNFTHNSANNISFGLNYYFFNQLITTRDRVMAITNGTFSWNFTIPIVQSKYRLNQSQSFFDVILILIQNYLSSKTGIPIFYRRHGLFKLRGHLFMRQYSYRQHERPTSMDLRTKQDFGTSLRRQGNCCFERTRPKHKQLC